MYQQVHLTERVVETVARGLDHRATIVSPTTARWDISGRCERPVYREMKGRQRPAGAKPWQTVMNRATSMHMLELETRCRKCGPCLRFRAAQWRRRIEAELKRSVRTWFVTLTLRPEEHFNALCRASLRLAERGQSFEELNDAEQFAERHREINPELTKWLKRVRKQSGAPLRYCLVAEAHKSGLPHYHLLISELDVTRPVRARTLSDQWKLGFSQARLVAKTDEAQHAAYAAKYLSKSAAARVRASKGYGVDVSSALALSQTVGGPVPREATAYDLSPNKPKGLLSTDAPTGAEPKTDTSVLVTFARPAYWHGGGMMPQRIFRRSKGMTDP